MIRYILLLICLHHAISFAPFHHLEKNTLSTGLSSTSNQRPAAHHLQAVVNGNDNHNDNVKNINDAKQKKTTSSSYLGYDSDDETKSSRTKKRVAAVAAVASQVNGYAERSDYERQKRRRPRRRDDTDVADSIINGSGNTAILSIDDDDVDCIDGTNVARASAAAADDDNDETCTIENGDFQVLVEELAESIDLDREQTRMDSFSSYILVTCLTATASFATVKGQGVIDGLDWPTMLIHYGAVAISTIAALSGTYATVIFSMTSIVSFSNKVKGGGEFLGRYLSLLKLQLITRVFVCRHHSLTFGMFFILTSFFLPLTFRKNKLTNNELK